MSKFTIKYVNDLADIPHLLQAHSPVTWQVVVQEYMVPKYAVIMEVQGE